MGVGGDGGEEAGDGEHVIKRIGSSHLGKQTFGRLAESDEPNLQYIS